MLKRTSKVDSLKVKSILLSSVIQIGDSEEITGFTRVIAVQRQRELFYSNEANFEDFEIFSRLLLPEPIFEPLAIQSTSLNPIIKVGHIDVTGISAGAVLHIGSSEHVQMESRTHHIRQLESVAEKQPENTGKEE